MISANYIKNFQAIVIFLLAYFVHLPLPCSADGTEQEYRLEGGFSKMINAVWVNETLLP
jgi:hypothetical protein